MEHREGLIDFRNRIITETVTIVSSRKDDDKKPVTKTISTTVLEYRQCFKGIWTPWKIIETV
jgi:hypothetical protein